MRPGGVPLMVEKRGRGLPMADPMRRDDSLGDHLLDRMWVEELAA